MSSSSTAVNIPKDSNAKEDTGKAAAPAGAGAAAAAPAGPAGSKKRAIHRGEWKRGVYVFDFALRLAAIAAALAATITMGTADETLPFFTQFRFHASYDDLPALLFFVIANAIVSGYFVLSLPFSFVTIIRPRAVGLRLLLLVFDTVMVGLSSAAAASAAAMVYLAHTGSSKANWLAICQQFKDLCQRMGGAVVASFLAALIVMLLVVMSALALRKP